MRNIKVHTVGRAKQAIIFALLFSSSVTSLNAIVVTRNDWLLIKFYKKHGSFIY